MTKSDEATPDMKPQWKSEIRQRLAGLHLAPTREAAIVEELAQYMDDYYAELLASGTTEAEAYQRTLAELSGSELLAHELRRAERQGPKEPVVLGTNRRTSMIADLWQDLRYGARMLLKQPGFTLIAALTLALGIGANTAIFSVVNALLLRPPAGVEQAERLVSVTSEGSSLGPSYPDYIDYRDRNTTFAGLAVFSPTTLHLGAGGEAERIPATLVSGNYFTVLGVKTARGRTLITDDDTAPGANPVTVISDGLWRRRFNADPNIVGQTVRLNGYPFTVIGVASPEFIGVEIGRATDAWIPISMAAQADPTSAGSPHTRVARGWLRAFGSLKPNVSLEQAQAELSSLALELERSFPDTNKGVGVRLIPHLGLGPAQRNDARNFTSLLAAVAALVLLIACANVANLLLARGQRRQKEIGIRLALGATRLRLIRQLLIESLMLSLLGGALGAFVAFWLSNPLKNFVAFGQENYHALDLSLDTRALGFTFFIAVVTGLLFGLIPALQAARTELTPVLKDAARSGRGKLRINLSSLLVIGQIALSLVVLIAAGLFVRTLQKAQSVHPGFNAGQVVTASLDVGKQGYSESQGRQFYRQIIERVEALPGVRSASMAHTVPFTDRTWNTRVRAESQANAAPLPVDYNVVSPRYFATLEIPFVSGRDFNAAGEPQAPGAVILNETLARRLFPGENPIGKRLIRYIRSEPKLSLEVVGVVKDAKYQQLTEQPRPQMYLPSPQQYRSVMTLHVRTERDPGELLAAIRREARSLDGNLPIFNAGLLSEHLRASLAPQRSVVALIGTFGLLALALAGIGLYGVMAYTVSQHTRDIGVRMALGAQTGDVLKLVVRQGMALALIGLVIGLIASLGLTRLTKTLLYDVSPTDPLTFAVIAVLLLLVALLACWIPARRATKVDPLIALRSE
jgi:macrolide transport system ATP-binding/permease protein